MKSIYKVKQARTECASVKDKGSVTTECVYYKRFQIKLVGSCQHFNKVK